MARTRRELLRDSGAAMLVLALPASVFAAAPVLSASELRTLKAAVARIIPAEHAGDWSAADVGADLYIQNLLAGPGQIFAGGPNRAEFAQFQKLSRIKRQGWAAEVERLRGVYRAGLKQLDARAGGNFAGAPAVMQDTILRTLDLGGSDFFAALYHHVMEGVYSHPVYGGNRNYRAWQTFGYQGDVHGVRFPAIGPPDASWNVHGGYAPEEMRRPGG
jgi:gluconate 2-dehydrogenase gamma chain